MPAASRSTERRVYRNPNLLSALFFTLAALSFDVGKEQKKQRCEPKPGFEAPLAHAARPTAERAEDSPFH